MKKIITIIAALTALTNISKAQSNEDDIREKASFGLKIGTNYSNVYDTQGEKFQADPSFGLAIGGFFAIPIGKYLGIQPELLFSQKGFHGTGTFLGSSYDFTRTTNYIDVPLMFALKPSGFLTLLAGPQYSYLIKQTDVFTNATTSIQQQKEFENDNFRKNTFCFTGGVDINIKHVVLGARVGWDLQNNNGDGSTSTPRYKNVWYQATIGYRFSN